MFRVRNVLVSMNSMLMLMCSGFSGSFSYVVLFISVVGVIIVSELSVVLIVVSVGIGLCVVSVKMMNCMLLLNFRMNRLIVLVVVVLICYEISCLGGLVGNIVLLFCRISVSVSISWWVLGVSSGLISVLLIVVILLVVSSVMVVIVMISLGLV